MVNELLKTIKTLWDERFVMHMDENAKIQFPKELEEIRRYYNNGNFQKALEIAHENYQWAFNTGDREAELSPIGWNYNVMGRNFQDLENVIKMRMKN